MVKQNYLIRNKIKTKRTNHLQTSMSILLVDRRCQANPIFSWRIEPTSCLIIKTLPRSLYLFLITVCRPLWNFLVTTFKYNDIINAHCNEPLIHTIHLSWTEFLSDKLTKVFTSLKYWLWVLIEQLVLFKLSAINAPMKKLYTYITFQLCLIFIDISLLQWSRRTFYVSKRILYLASVCNAF